MTSIFRALPLLVLIAPAFADDPSRIKQLEDEVRTLRRLMSKQDERITVLEQRLLPSPSRAQPEPARSSRTVPPWHSPATWQKLKHGMSERQVVAILGPPTSSSEGAGMRTLFYRGEVLESGFVSGNVQFMNDRALWIEVPVF